MSSLFEYESTQTSPFSNYYLGPLHGQEGPEQRILFNQKEWICSLAPYQASKFLDQPEGENYAEVIRIADKPMKITALGTLRKVNRPLSKSDPRLISKTVDQFKVKGLKIRPDWNKIKLQVMHDVLLAKFSQNPELGELLLQTGDKIIVEVSTRNSKPTFYKDPFWDNGGKTGNGIPKSLGGTMEGENWMGRLLMKVRDEIRPPSVEKEEEEVELNLSSTREFPPL